MVLEFFRSKSNIKW